MFSSPIFLLGLSALFAGIPVGIWIYFLFSKKQTSRKIIALVFFLGCLTAPALLGIQYAWEIVPQFNLAKFIEDSITTQNTMFIATFVLFGAMEEIIKHFVVRQVDKRSLAIQTIDDSIRFSFASALGFSFIENGYYLIQFWPSISIGQLVGMYIFRAIFTTCAHLIFSGIFGYFYGIGKFSIDLNEQNKISGQTPFFTRVIAKTFDLPKSQAYREQMIFKGLIIAIGMHAFYNYLLQFNIILPALIFIILGYLYMHYLLSRKTGNLVLLTDISARQKSGMAKKDEDVIIELMGMWFKEKRYVDVIHICERLLERDPDNNVVKIFKARAMDMLEEKNIYRNILNSVLKSKEDLTPKDESLIAKYLSEKDQLSKAKS